MTDDQHYLGGRQQPRTDYPVCPSCGSSSFYVDGFLSYRQRYDANRDTWRTSVIDWDFDNPVRAYCTQCETDASELLRKRGLIDLYEVSWSRNHG